MARRFAGPGVATNYVEMSERTQCCICNGWYSPVFFKLGGSFIDGAPVCSGCTLVRRHPGTWRLRRLWWTNPLLIPVNTWWHLTVRNWWYGDPTVARLCGISNMIRETVSWWWYRMRHRETDDE
jgi:hypothetical protein